MTAAHNGVRDPPPARETILDVIGRTPMVRLGRVSPRRGATIWGKCELLNPGGSAKDRVGRALIERAERDGLLRGGGTIIEASSGNTAVALAQACAVKGYACVLVVSPKVSDEKRRIVEALGARLVVSKEYRETARRLASEIEGAVFVDQFSNPAATEIHEMTTGPEIWEQLGGRIDAFVAGVGTGGTLIGVARYLRWKDPRVKIVCADPPGSLLSGPWQPYLVEGIGVDSDLPSFDPEIVDEVVTIPDASSFAWARRLAREEGILAGGSSGAALAAASLVAQRLPPEANVVALLADTGRNYLSKFFDDAWSSENGLAPSAGGGAS